MSEAPPRPPRGLIACLCAVFTAIGLSIAALGPALPEFARVAHLEVPSVGLLYSALFAGFLASQVSASFLFERRSTRAVVLGSLVLFAAGTLGLAIAADLPWLLVASGVLGMGYGFGTIGVNLVASRLVPHRPAFVVNLVNVLYGVGTVTGPLITSAVLRAGGEARLVPAVGGLVALTLFPWVASTLPSDVRPQHRADPGPRRRWIPLPLLLIGMLVFLYGGIEAGWSGWAATYLERTLGVSAAHAALLTSMYWLAYVGGRVVSTVLALRIGPATVLEGSLAVLAAGGLVLALSVGHVGGTTVGLLLLGGATGPIYPSMFGTVTARFPDRAAFAVSTVAAIGCVGAIVLPWTMGLTLPVAGGRVLAATPVVLACGMWLAYKAASRVRR